MASKSKQRIHFTATAVNINEATATDKAAQTNRRDYSGIPASGFVRLSQIARNPKNPDVPAPIPVSPITIWRWVAADKFPKPVKLSGNVTAWRAEDVHAWLDRQATRTPAQGGAR